MGFKEKKSSSAKRGNYGRSEEEDDDEYDGDDYGDDDVDDDEADKVFGAMMTP